MKALFGVIVMFMLFFLDRIGEGVVWRLCDVHVVFKDRIGEGVVWRHCDVHVVFQDRIDDGISLCHCDIHVVFFRHESYAKV